MGIRYSDRFFGAQPTGRSGEEEGGRGSDDAHPVSGSPGEEWIEVQARPRRPWRAYQLVAAAAAGGLVVGAVAGAFGWEQRRKHQDDLAAQSALEVRLAASLVDTATVGGPMTVNVTIHNDGVYPVTVTGLRSLDERLTSLDGDGFRATSIAPGDDGVATATFEMNCVQAAQGIPADGAAILMAIRTADAQVHETELTTAGGSALCGSAVSASWVDVPIQVISVQSSARAVTATMLVGTDGVGPHAGSEVLDVSAAGDAFAAVWDSTTTTVDPSTGNAQLVVNWSVQDCQKALAAQPDDMKIQVTGRLNPGDAAVPTTFDPTADLAAALVRLSVSMCP